MDDCSRLESGRPSRVRGFESLPFRKPGQGAAEGMLAYMQRTTVKLPDELDARLRHEAQRRGVTVSELTREAIETPFTPERLE